LWQNFCLEKKCYNQTLLIMKKETSICAFLGVSQQEMSMLLGVSRSLWSLYELGQRDLPLRAKQLLGELLTHVQTNFTAAKSTPPPPRNEQLQRLERQLRDNEYQRMLMVRKIAKATKKHEAQARLAHLVAFLSSRDTSKHSVPNLQEAFASKASPDLEAQFSDTLTDLKHRHELLELEKLLLESRALRMRSALENTGDS